MSLLIRRAWVYLADLNPRQGTDPGKVRPVLVVQTDLLNETHPSTLVCPLTTKITPQASVLRVHVRHGTAGLEKDSDVMVDQIRAIDVRRLITALGALPEPLFKQVVSNLAVLLESP